MTHDGILDVLQSALNNLRGIPGRAENNYEDRFFAYTDLGGHLASLYFIVQLLRGQESSLWAIWIFAFLVVAGRPHFVSTQYQQLFQRTGGMQLPTNETRSASFQAED